MKRRETKGRAPRREERKPPAVGTFAAESAFVRKRRGHHADDTRAEQQAVFDRVADTLRKVHDLSDVARAVSVAAKLMGESLEQIAADLHRVAEISSQRSVR